LIVPNRWYLITYVLCCAGLVLAQQQKKKDKMTHHTTGPFEVKLTPQPSEAGSTTLARMTIDKQFRGELEAVSQGQMLSAMTATKGSAGYVAMEVVNGTLGGHKGTFVLQHSATMDRGQSQLSVTVVPDSGTGELRGLSGSMKIRIEPGGKHFYEFEYQIAETP
jgi:uncharacterized protein DUF3224